MTSEEYEIFHGQVVRYIRDDLDNKELLKLRELIDDRLADRNDGGYEWKIYLEMDFYF